MNLQKTLIALLLTSFTTAPVVAAEQTSWYKGLAPYYPQQESVYGDKYELTLLPHEKKRVAVEMLATDHAPETQHVLLKNNPGKSLGLFGDNGLLQTIDRTQTAVGHAVLAGMLASASKQEITQRQSAVRLLAQNSQLADELHAALKKFAEAESVFLKIYASQEAPATGVPSTTWMSTKSVFNRTATLANICGFGIPVPEWAATGFVTASIGAILAKAARFPQPFNVFKKAWVPYHFSNLFKTVEDAADNEHANEAQIMRNFNGKSTFLMLWWAASAAYGLYRYRTTAIDLSAQQVPLRALSVGLVTMEEILKMVESDDRLTAAIPELQSVKGLFDQYASRPEELKTFLEWLQNDTFKKPFSMLDSDPGTIMAAQKLSASATRLQLRNAFEAIGKLDAYLSMATLITESKAQRYTFVKWIKRPQPLVKLTRLWNPRGGQQPVSISLGSDTRTIVTNAEDSKMIANALLLAHTFGVVPADEAEMTQFDDMVVHCDNTEDGTVCLNLFASGRRSSALGIAIIEGPATENHSSSDNCVSLARSIAKMPNTVAVVATQCPHATSVLGGR
jgi:hypothetical protein